MVHDAMKRAERGILILIRLIAYVDRFSSLIAHRPFFFFYCAYRPFFNRVLYYARLRILVSRILF